MEGLKRHVCRSQGRRSGVRERQREKEMPLCLYECLKAVGLQHHYASFTSVGVQRAAHLSVLTMEDYPLLGIRSMEDRTRLFHLVQMVKTLDLEYENDDHTDAADVGEEVYVVTDSSLTYDGCEDPDVDPGAAVSKLKGIPKPSSVRRRLEFGCESVDHHLKPRSYPESAVHVYASHNNVPVQSKESCTRVQLDPGSAEVCVCKGKNNQLPDFHHQSDHHTGESIMEGNYSHRLSPKCHSFNKPRPAASYRFNKNPVGKKDGKGISRKEKVRTKISSHRASEHTAKPTPVYQSKRTAGYNYGLPLSSPSTGKKQAGGQRISVCVRKRPLTHTECRTGETDVVTTPSGESVIVHESKEAVDLSEYILQHRFYFDQVFGEDSSNMEVYQRTAYPLVQHMLNGGKATCFAYGQTGAGKTHTMLGSAARPGLYSLAVRDIFSHLSTTHLHPPLLVYVSFFEIYCGQLYDLLDHRKRLFAREDGQNVVHIVGLRDVRVDSVTSLLEVISQGTEERTQGMSAVNPLSSRSHALLQIQLRDTNQLIFGRMWFVDLAGSERASDTRDPDKQSRMEGAEINQSLLALKECIRSLDQEQAHTPFRQSKLTQVLKDSFVGDSMTCMIANISPGHSATEHTLNTLRYADRVKELRGHGGRRGKTINSSRHNLLHSSSTGGNSIGTRGKSPPKKPKLGRQREDFGPTTPTMRSPKGGSFFCSTPKNSRWGDETSTRKEIGLEHITPVRDLLGRGDKRERTDGRKGRRRERNGVTGSDGHLDGDHNVSGQATDEQYHLWEELKKSGFYLRERENQQITLNQGENEGRRQVESSRNTVRGVERGLQKADERNEEREKHLRKYHQQLQQFMPPSVSSSSSLSSPSTSFSSSVSPSSSSSLHSGLRCHGFGEVLDAYRAQVDVRGVQSSFFPSGGICLETQTSSIYNNKKDEVAQSGVGKELRVSREVTEPRFVQDGGKHEKRGSLKAAGRELGGEETRRWATTTEWADGMTGAWPADVEALVSCNCDSGGSRNVGEDERDAADVPADGSLITEERKRADACSFLSTHSDSGIFTQSPAKSSYQRAPAERPLSPVCGHTNAPLTPNKPPDPSLKSKHTTCPLNTLQKAQQGVPISSCREKTPGLAAHANRRDFSDSQPATLPPTTPTTQTGCKIPPEPHNVLSESPAYTTVCKHPEVNAKMSVFVSPEETADTHSYLMDPISKSLLHVDRRVATAEQNQISLCPLERESRKDNEGKVCVEMVGELEVGEDIELSLSLLELPQATSIDSHNSVSSTVTNHIDTMPKQRLTGHSNISPQPNGPIKPHSKESNACKEHISPIFHLSVLEDLDHGQCGVVQAHWKQLEEMEALFHKEGTLLSHQPDMAFAEYVHKLEDILERKARCVLNMMAQLQPYLQPRHSDQPIK